MRSTGIEPACPGDTRSLVLRVCQFRHDRISAFSDLFILLFLRSICKCFFAFSIKMFYGCALSGSNPPDCIYNKRDTLKDVSFVMVRSKGFEPPWSPTRTWTVRVCQFRHDRISHWTVLLYNTQEQNAKEILIFSKKSFFLRTPTWHTSKRVYN